MSRILALDVGSKTLGVAVSDPLGWTAQGLEIIKINENKGQWGFDRLAEILSQYPCKLCVIGLPYNMDGSKGERALKSQSYGDKFSQHFQIPVVYQDERLTSRQAERMLIEEGDISRQSRKKVIDKLAAVLILQNYLDQH